MSEPRTADPAAPSAATLPHQDDETVALLLDEVARLEAELHARDESAAADAADRAAAGPGVGDRLAFEATELRRVVGELRAEVEARDETVTLLLEQGRLFEEAAEAGRDEWRQLHEWVEEVERRVEAKDRNDARLADDLAEERRRSEALQIQVEVERRSADALRRELEREVERLGALAARAASGDGPADFETQAALIALGEENRRLRLAGAERDRLAADAERLARRLDLATAERDQALAEALRLGDDLRRDQAEAKAALAALRSELSGLSLGAPPPADPAAPSKPARPTAREADERIRAFRLHLKELHEDATRRRDEGTLAARLSKLWRHSGPT